MQVSLQPFRTGEHLCCGQLYPDLEPSTITRADSKTVLIVSFSLGRKCPLLTSEECHLSRQPHTIDEPTNGTLNSTFKRAAQGGLAGKVELSLYLYSYNRFRCKKRGGAMMNQLNSWLRNRALLLWTESSALGKFKASSVKQKEHKTGRNRYRGYHVSYHYALAVYIHSSLPRRPRPLSHSSGCPNCQLSCISSKLALCWKVSQRRKDKGQSQRAKPMAVPQKPSGIRRINC